jgi:hypothetical protein
MNFRINLLSNAVYILPALSVGVEKVEEKDVWWISLTWLSFNVVFDFKI